MSTSTKIIVNKLEVISDIVPFPAKDFTEYDIGIDANWRTILYSEDAGRFVALGVNVTNPAYSSNGIDWDTASSIGLKFIYDCVYGNDKFVSIASDGDIITSTDGTSWDVESSSILSSAYQAIIYVSPQNRYIVSGAGGSLGYLDNNLNPTSVSAPPSLSSASFQGLATDGTSVISCISNFASGKKIIKSEDYGESWTVFNHIQEENYGIAYSEELDLWVTVGRNGTAYSADGGENWSAGSIDDSNWYDLIYEPNTNLFMAVSNNRLGANSLIAYSKDGKNFITVSTTSTDARSITYAPDKGVFAAIGSDSTFPVRVSTKNLSNIPYNG